MVKNLLNLKTTTLVVFTLILANGLKTFAQETSDKSIYNWFDSKIGKENTGLNNAPLYVNLDKPIKDHHTFLKTDQYTIGDIIYDGQPYFDIKLKYNIYSDQLVMNPFGQFDNVAVALIQEKTTSFSIYNKQFLKLNLKITSLPDFTAGYYEVAKANDNLILYIKHHKDNNKIVKDDGVFYSYKTKNRFYLLYNNNYYEVNSKKSVQKIFPEFKSNIKTFYNLNSEIYKNDDSDFMKKMIFQIDALLNNKSN